MKLNNDVSLAKNNNNSLAGWAGHCSAILSGIDNLGGTRSLLCSAILYHHCQLLLPLTYCFSGFDKLNPKNTVAMPIFHNIYLRLDSFYFRFRIFPDFSLLAGSML